MQTQWDTLMLIITRHLLLINSDEDHEVEKGGVISASKWLS